MGNGLGRFRGCLCRSGIEERLRRRQTMAEEPHDEGLGHSFCYVRPDPCRLSSSKVHHSEDSGGPAKAAAAAPPAPPPPTFRSLSGASVSANTATALSTAMAAVSEPPPAAAAAAFDCTTSFFSVPLQPVPRGQLYQSGPLSGPIDRGFMSGPIERGFLSGPLDRTAASPFRRSFSHGRASLVRRLKRPIARTFARGRKAVVAPIKALSAARESDGRAASSGSQSLDGGDDKVKFDGGSLQWAQGKAGEDRVHVVISEEHGWVFVGIYDGFNGPDAPDFLLSNLYSAVHAEMEGLLWREDDGEDVASEGPTAKKPKRWEQTQRMWKNEWDKEQLAQPGASSTVDQAEVLKALSSALRKTEEAYLDIADNMVSENPELALMGSCVLVMLMKGEDVYVMNVGDSRVVLARASRPGSQDLGSIDEESFDDFEVHDEYETDGPPCLAALQLTLDHSTAVAEEIQRIRREHQDDAAAVINDRVKGSLKVTRAFGAGFLKQPKWNDALLEAFRIDYVGSSPYITCEPWLRHHRLGPRDRFLILSSDGLYQYFTNEEAVTEVELFIDSFPEGDPAQHLVEEVLFRAARKAGMDFHQLLEIPQGDRRKYHDDVSVIVISLEGRIWRYSL
ncbi:putative protein phosphatase 2C 23 isoform X2 [Wolffia australiana]